MSFQELLQPWGLPVTTEPKVIGDDVIQLTLADGRLVVLKALGSTREPVLRRLESERDVLLHVEHTGLAVAVPLLPRPASLTAWPAARCILYRAGCPIALELRLFEWLIRQRAGILAQIDAGVAASA